MAKYDNLRERALANFELLLDHWNINYTKIGLDEYDFINPTRDDKNFGACRFNISKGIGADFSGADFTMADYKRVGIGLGKEDFAGLLRGDRNGWGFDIIGLCQRLFNIQHYSNAAKLLQIELRELKSKTILTKPIRGAKELREHKRNEQKHKTLIYARKTWEMCGSFHQTVGDIYLRSRKLYITNEPNIKFHAKIFNKELGFPIPALLFQVQEQPHTPLVAIHRIYLAKDGSRRANIENQKMALGSIKGAGIWFGSAWNINNDTPNKQLCIVEGPENALTIRSLGYPFVVSTINATNFSNISIPDYVEEIILMPDPDQAGRENAKKAAQQYKSQTRSLKVVFPEPKKLSTGKLADWNDLLCGKE